MTMPTPQERADTIRFMNFINHGTEWRQLKDIRRDIERAIADATAALEEKLRAERDENRRLKQYLSDLVTHGQIDRDEAARYIHDPDDEEFRS